MMPTAAKLVAAIILGGTGFFVSEQIKEGMPADTAFGAFSIVNLAIGAVCGWIIIGRRAGRGYASGISVGITAVFLLVVWGLLAQGAYEMVHLAMRHRYDGPVEALVNIVQLAMEWSIYLIKPEILFGLAGGGVFAGMGGEFAARRWR